MLRRVAWRRPPRLTPTRIRGALDAAAAIDPDIARAVARVGYPDPRRRPEGFETLLRAIVGQQVSVAAATAIHRRLVDCVDGDVCAEALLRRRETTLRKAGLSRPKVRYARALARAVADEELDLAALRRMPDEQVVAALTAIPGLGVWSAQMYLIFSLGRPDVWPHGDVGVLRGLQYIKQLEERPTPRDAEALVLPHRPQRSAVALLAWKHANTPGI
jgi:DNA-3-methyladenine glycosylase II